MVVPGFLKGVGMILMGVLKERFIKVVSLCLVILFLPPWSASQAANTNQSHQLRLYVANTAAENGLIDVLVQTYQVQNPFSAAVFATYNRN